MINPSLRMTYRNEQSYGNPDGIQQVYAQREIEPPIPELTVATGKFWDRSRTRGDEEAIEIKVQNHEWHGVARNLGDRCEISWYNSDPGGCVKTTGMTNGASTEVYFGYVEIGDT